MNNNKAILAIIPARAGSKRLPKKNSKLLLDKPLIEWTIEAAKACNLLDCVMVTTDDQLVANISKELCVNVPFLRPEALAQDNSSSIDVVIHAIDFYRSNGKHFDYVMLLQPTSPLRNSQHITEAVELLIEKNADAIISVCPCEHSPLWSNTLEESGSMVSFLSGDLLNKRSQDLPDFYRINGAIYLVKTERLIKEKSFFIRDKIFAYKMSAKESVDIDEEVDFLFAEAILKNRELT